MTGYSLNRDVALPTDDAPIPHVVIPPYKPPHRRIDYLLGFRPERITIDIIQRMAAAQFDIPLAEMKSQRRARVIARPRQVAMYLAKHHTTRSLPEIGRRFGGRDHTTVLHAIRRIEQLRAEDADLDADIKALEARL
jgi:chromosomal replication initiator protein